MTGEELFELLGQLDPELVDGAEDMPKKRGNRLMPAAFISLAACAAVLALVLLPSGIKKGGSEMNGNTGSAPNMPMDYFAAPDDASGEGAPDSSTDQAAPETDGSVGADMTNGAPGSDSGGTYGGTGWLDAVVVGTDGELVVAPEEGSPYFGMADRFILTMTDSAPEELPGDLEAGDRVRIQCDMDGAIRRGDGSYEIPAVRDIRLLGGE